MLRGRYSAFPLIRTHPPPSRLRSISRFAGYTIYLAPVISPRDEEGFASYSVCPCYRAVAFTPPRWRCRIGQISAPHSAFALRKQARPSDLRLSRPHLRSLSYGPAAHSQFASTLRAPRGPTLVPHCVGSLTRSCTTMKWDYHYPGGPRSCSSYVVSSRHHLIDPICPTRGHIAISPHGGLYAMSSLCGSA